MTAINSKHQKVSDSSGEAPSGPKKDGYASGSVPKQMIGTKVGVTNNKGYSGPNVATASRGE